jgi:arginine utilization regulatory protein
LREDLFYRLNVISLTIPPLRERKEDIPLLVEYFIECYNKKLGKNVKGVSPEAMKIFVNYRWPGNVRELKSTIESIMNFIEGDIIEVKHLPQENHNYFLPQKEVQPPRSNSNFQPLKKAVDNFEKNLILKAINEANGNFAEAARLLKVPRQTLHNKIKKYGLTKKIIAE